MTRIEKERFDDPAECERLKDSFILTRVQVDAANDGTVIMHPLPRINEIAADVDGYAGAAHFRQAANGFLCAWRSWRWSPGVPSDEKRKEGAAMTWSTALKRRS